MTPFFFFHDTATTEIYTLSLHDALPISFFGHYFLQRDGLGAVAAGCNHHAEDAFIDQFGASGTQPSRQQAIHRRRGDRKSTRLNSSHSQISYAVFCLKKKKKQRTQLMSG